jgi:hypothetical protein
MIFIFETPLFFSGCMREEKLERKARKDHARDAMKTFAFLAKPLRTLRSCF